MRLTILLSLAAALTQNLLAVTVAPDVAASAARGFALRGRTFGAPLGRFVERTARLYTTNGIPFYVVRLSGGGTVFLSADTEETPVIAYTSSTNDFSTLNPRSPLAALLNRDLAVRAARPCILRRSDPAAEWTALTEADRPLLSLSAMSQTTVGDVRVPALVESQWGQGSVDGSFCYNYYTPNHSVCGCVATAMSQVMRRHRHPSQSRPVRMHQLCFVNGKRTTLTTQGGTYDWANMPLRPDSTLTEAQCQSIGKLTSDAGISVEMQYTSDLSGTYSVFVPEALMSDFGYAQAHFAWADDESGFCFSSAGIGKAILSNLDAGLPVLLGIGRWTGSAYDNGHSIVADGYGYQGDDLYIHLNLGWSGASDLWYHLPDIGTWAGFNVVDEVVYNIHPDSAAGRILSGRVTEATGLPASGAVVSLRDPDTKAVRATTTASPSGVYAFVIEAGAYDVTAVSSDGAAVGSRGPVVVSDPVEHVGTYSTWPRKTYTYVSSEAELGNSWGSDFVLSTNVVVLTVVCEAPPDAVAATSPMVGTMTFASGAEVTLAAPSSVECTNGFATAYARCPYLGFAGTGSLPASGTTNVLTVALTNDTTVVWRYRTAPSHYRLRTWETFPDWWLYWSGNFYSSFWMNDEWLEAGSSRSYALPEDAIDGDVFDWTTWFYPPGQDKPSRGALTMKLCGVALSEPGETEEVWQFDALRRQAMPTNVTLRIDRAYDVDFVYLPTIDFWTNKLPSWWVLRHLYGPLENGLIDEISERGDPDGDGCSNLREYRTGTDPMDPRSCRLPFMVLIF